MAESETKVLCGANSYNQKYYFNKEFNRLPEQVKNELQILCVWFTEEVGGMLTLEFEPDGVLVMKTQADDSDYYYDEISAGLKMHQAQIEHKDLFESLELFYRVVFLGEQVNWSEEDS